MADALNQTLTAARKYNAAALEAIIELYGPRVNRLAFGLGGSERTGRKIARVVQKQSLTAIPKMRDADTLERWFNHRVVLESRQHEAASREDVLLAASPRQDAAYAAFVRAFRTLPTQQREAVLLTHGERLNARYTGVAMDCSADAAANHLRAATVDLRGIAGAAYDPLLEAFVAAYRALTPPTELMHRDVRKHVARHLLPRRIKRAVLLLILAAGAFAGWHWHGVIRSMFPG